MKIVSSEAENYISKFSSKDDVELFKIYQETVNNHPQQHMQSSWVQGQVLSFISELMKPKNILEIGTFTGYSAICLSKGLQSSGELHTIENREIDALTAQSNFSIFKNKNQIHLHLGNALEIIPKLNKKWDLVFIDADKTNYINYYNLVLPRLKKNGLIIADNVLFHGQVFEKVITGKNAIAINEFNEFVLNDIKTQQIILSIRDGLMFIKKK